MHVPRPALELADILRAHAPAYAEDHPLTGFQALGDPCHRRLPHPRLGRPALPLPRLRP